MKKFYVKMSFLPKIIFENLIATVNEEGQVAKTWLTQKYVLHLMALQWKK
tara:strand:- start:498 stop:647 length:150 start_codon:yes stop_codon:yes gene_type:complete